MGIDGLGTSAADLAFGAAGVGGSGVDQTSLEPQASAFEILARLLVVDVGAAVGLVPACDDAEGAERLNAELISEDALGAF